MSWTLCVFIADDMQFFDRSERQSWNIAATLSLKLFWHWHYSHCPLHAYCLHTSSVTYLMKRELHNWRSWQDYQLSPNYYQFYYQLLPTSFPEQNNVYRHPILLPCCNHDDNVKRSGPYNIIPHNAVRPMPWKMGFPAIVVYDAWSLQLPATFPANSLGSTQPSWVVFQFHPCTSIERLS